MTVAYNLPPAGVTERQLEQLQPYLIGERPREDGEWDMFCPLHADENRSAQLNVEKGVWFCHAGCGGGPVAALIRKSSDWIAPTAAARNGTARPRAMSGQPAEEITSAKVKGWQAALAANEVLLEDFITSRGLWSATLGRFEIGWDSNRNAYTIPVRNRAGEFVNVRRYQPRPPKGRRKMWGVKGMNAPRLYPIQIFEDDPREIVVCEGELDALITNQYGFAAVTRTASAITWKPVWNKLFKGRIVYLCHDMDAAGQEANRKTGLALAKVAKELRVVRLPYPFAESHGRDLTDYWLDHEGDPQAFRRLLEESQPFDTDTAEEDPDDLAPDEVAVLDSFDARRVGRPLRLTVTVKGKREPGYSVPRKVRYRCSQDAGAKCEGCPLFEGSGDETRVISGGDPVVLELIEATRKQARSAVVASAGVPENCPRLNVDVTEFQSVEVLFARPSVDQMGGTGMEAGDYKTITLTSVGRHDTMPNNTVRAVGALYPDPRTHLNQFLTHDITRMETSLDRFRLDAETLNELKRFRPRAGQTPLKKVREIADDLAAHVTRIYGRPELHAAMDLAFHAVTAFDFAGKRVSRGWIELLVVGDSRTGKSEAATRLCRHFGAGEVVSCETATLAGIIGGLQQPAGRKEWTITWGAIPLNDRRLVVLDEVGGLEPEDIAKMSSIRSSGIAELTKIQQERTYARTRTIWLANPRSTRMSDYTFGVQAIRPLIGNAEDIARFDLAMTVAAGEVASGEINRSHRDDGEPRYTSESCSKLLRWAWSRTAEQVTWARGAERSVYAAARDLGSRYVEEPPLIQVANVREKIARIAVALAARTFSTDESGERIVVRRDHVRDAVAFIDKVYSMHGFGYAARSAELIEDQREAERNSRKVKVYLYNKPWLAKFMRSAGKFRRQDLEEVGNIDKEQANAIISTLIDAKVLYKEKGDVKLTPTLHRLLREVNIR